MSRRKQAKPRALKHEDEEDDPILKKQNNRPQTTNEIDLEPNGTEEDEIYEENQNQNSDLLNDDSSDSFCSDIYLSQTSSSFSPSLSEGATTPNSIIHDTENNRLSSENVDEDANESPIKKLKVENEKGEKYATTVSKEHHSANGGGGGVEGTYHCQFCDKSFPRLGYLKKHEQSHAEHMPFKCDYCARLFKHKRSRDRHTKLHTGDRRYRCPHCEAAFSRSDHLKIHMKTHDNQKPFQCTICNRGYNTAAALTSHMQNHKKQAALLGVSNMNYSPRSNGSTSSTGSLQKRKYSPTVMDQTTYTEFLHAKKTGSSMLYCIYCTKNDFPTVDQLHSHIQTMHATAKAHEPSPQNLPTDHLHLTCEFCTMKFPSIQTMFYHVRTTHIDQVNSPNAYIDHLNKITLYGKLTTNNNNNLNEMSNKRKIHQHQIVEENVQQREQITSVKSERTSPKSDHRSNKSPQSMPTPLISTPNIKQEPEQQDIPTDLSKKPNKDDDIQNNISLSDIQSNTVIATSPKLSAFAANNTNSTNGSFLCNQCNAALNDFESFRNHLKSHISQGMSNFICQHCGITLTNQSDFDRHTISHFLITNSEFCCNNFSCNNKVFTKSDDLQKHLIEMHAQSVYKCTICSDLFETKVAIQVHFAVAHSNEIKLYRCSACMDTFKSETDFRHHVKTRHSTVSGSVQCLFCRTVCASELEMHFHLAAHARQFRCPACPESFHVEFLLDRHMQTHHTLKDQSYHYKSVASSATGGVTNVVTLPPPPLPPSLNNNNNILDYHQYVAAATAAGNAKNAYNMFSNKTMYNQLQIDTNNAAAANNNNNNSATKHPSGNLYGFYNTIGKNRFESTGAVATKNLLEIYNTEFASKLYNIPTDGNNGLPSSAIDYNNTVVGSTKPTFYNVSSPRIPNKSSHEPSKQPLYGNHDNQDNNTTNNNAANAKSSVDRNNSSTVENGFSCGICEMNDFCSEAEAHTHRKVAHNIKTGVSLRCAYCNGNFRSRNELENHMKSNHNTTGKHKCLICDEIFPSPAVLAEHKLSHSKVGPSGKCSRCATNLPDVTAFKSHMAEHGTVDIPLQCICCRQTLNSEFEVGLHARFHTKSSEHQEKTCALCLDLLPSNSDTKVCEKCFKKHNFGNKFQNFSKPDQLSTTIREIEYKCNICKVYLVSPIKLQEHLIEHSFKGCDDRGYSCYICSTIFAVPAGLQTHMNEHGHASMPYDCNVCTAKFFFRAELEHHLIDHENGRIVISMPSSVVIPNNVTSQNNTDFNQSQLTHINSCETEIRKDSDSEHNGKVIPKTEVTEDDEEYIEIEKVVETTNTNDDNNRNNNEAKESGEAN